MAYKVTNVSRDPISLNSPGDTEDDLYLKPGVSGLSKTLPVLRTEMRSKILIENLGGNGGDGGNGEINLDGLATNDSVDQKISNVNSAVNNAVDMIGGLSNYVDSSPASRLPLITQRISIPSST